MQLAWITAFVHVAEQRSFVRAAQTLRRPQSRISTHLAQLEAELGVVLIDRNRRPVGLTVAGETFLGRARDVLASLDQARTELAALHGRPHGTVRLACIASVAALHVPAVVDRFARIEPNLRIEVVEGATSTIPARVIARQADLGIAPRAYVERHPELTWTSLWREPIRALVPLTSPLAERASLSLHDFDGQDVITPGDDAGARGLSPEIAPIFADHGVVPRSTRRVAAPNTLVALVRVGTGIGLLSELAVTATDTTGLRVLPIDQAQAEREVVLAVLRHATPPPAVACVAAYLTRVAPPGHLAELAERR